MDGPSTPPAAAGTAIARPLPPLATLDATLAPAAIAATLHYAAAATSANTQAAYAADWASFSTWCATHGAAPLPCPPGLLCGYLAALAAAGRRAATIGRHAAGISFVHRQHGLEPPTNSEAVKAVLRGIRRTLGTAPVRKHPATHDLIARMMAACPADTVIGLRDRALLALGFAGALRRSELVALTLADLVAVPDGLRVAIRRSKTDQEGQGHQVAIPRGTHLRPVEAVQAWITVAALTDGPLFRRVTQTGRVSAAALGDDGCVRAIKRRARAAGLDPAGFSGHSLRAGFLTSAAEHGASTFKMQEVSRHRSLETLAGYVRRADLFKRHAGSGFL